MNGFDEEVLNIIIIPQLIKDEKIKKEMDKMSKIVKSINSSRNEDFGKYTIIHVALDKIDNDGKLIDELISSGIKEVEKWKFLPKEGLFKLYVKKVDS